MPPPKGRGRPAKRARNLIGLRNQPKVLPKHTIESDDEQQAHSVQETLVKHNLCQEEENDTSSAESEQSDWEDLEDDDVAEVLIKKAREDVLDGDDPFGDPDWIPVTLRRRIAQQAKNMGGECYNLSD